MQRSSLATLLVAALASAVSAQEPVRDRQPAPEAARDGRATIVTGRGGLVSQFDVLIKRRARLGVSVNFIAQATDSVGALINGVTPNGPAARAGLRSGDIITSFNGRPLAVRDARPPKGQSAPGIRLAELASNHEVGDTVVLQYRRGAERRVTTVVMGNEPSVVWTTPDGSFTYTLEESELPMRTAAPGEPSTSWRYTIKVDSLRGTIPLQRRDGQLEGTDHRTPVDGRVDASTPRPQVRLRTPMPPMAMMPLLSGPLAELELAPINPDLGRYFGTSEGILVIRAPGDSPLGLQGGDVILAVDGRAPSGPAHLLRILRTYAPSEQIRFDIIRMKKRETIRGTTAPLN